MTLGPERATFLERFVTAFRIPFSLGCLLLTSILGPPGAILSVYFQTQDLNEAVERTIFLFFGTELPILQGVIGLIILFVLLFYLLLMVRHMRMNLVKAEPKFLSILPEGEKTSHEVFGRVSQSFPPIVISLILIILFSLQAAPEIPTNFLVFGTAPENLLYLAIAYPIWFTIFSTFAWVYFSSIRGLHQLGKKPLKLKSFLEDKMLGVRPIGSLSLSFAFTYFFGLSILAFLPIVISPLPIVVTSNPSSQGYVGILAILAILGVIIFFLPLNTIHKKMLEAKQREQKTLREQFLLAFKGSLESVVQSPESSLLEIKDLLRNLTAILALDIGKKESSTIPTWPFDTPILGRLAAMIFSIGAILIANFILRLVIL